MANTPRDAEAGADAYLALVGLVGGGWMWLRMAEAASADRVGKKKLAEFYAKYLMAEASALEERAMLDAGLFDSLSSEQLIGQ